MKSILQTDKCVLKDLFFLFLPLENVIDINLEGEDIIFGTLEKMRRWLRNGERIPEVRQ